ncbi:unnamed protein product [Symbiodinium pilosum]|uniref:FHA domain-containing protein n=1 Tax=Symbiodinium pilosum TaxID=2952 RepID=A0A812J7M8_SYMPI|nr:unnamed protein product [Symbiodinium pilosum]
MVRLNSCHGNEFNPLFRSDMGSDSEEGSSDSGEAVAEGSDGDLEDADPDPEPLEDLDGAFADARDCWKIDAETLKGFYLHSPTGQLFSWDQAQGVLYEYIRESGECKAGSRVVFLEQAVIAEHDICFLCILHLSRYRAAQRAAAASEDFCKRLRLGNCALEALLSLPPAGQAYVLKTFCAPRSDPAGALCRQVEVLRRLGNQAPYASALEEATIRVPTSGAILGRCVPEVTALCWHDTDPVAAAHCRISSVDGQFSVCDLGADEEGTLFDGRRLGAAWCPLKDGCNLDMGPIRIRVELKPVQTKSAANNKASSEILKASAPAKRGGWRSAKRKGADREPEPAPKHPKADLKKVTAPLLREPSPEPHPAGLRSAQLQQNLSGMVRDPNPPSPPQLFAPRSGAYDAELLRLQKRRAHCPAVSGAGRAGLAFWAAPRSPSPEVRAASPEPDWIPRTPP